MDVHQQMGETFGHYLPHPLPQMPQLTYQISGMPLWSILLICLSICVENYIIQRVIAGLLGKTYVGVSEK